MLYIHIGLPKTATTSLQHLFNNKLEHIHYEGVIQPRKSLQNELYLQMIKWVNEGNRPWHEDEINAIKSLINNELDKYDRILISEEGLCVDSSVSWQEKLSCLNLMVNEFDYRIIVTVREPILAAYSLYVELYRNFRNKYEDFDDFFTNSNQAKIYNYRYLYDFLINTFGNEKIIFVSFEDIVKQDKLDLSKLFSDYDWNDENRYLSLIKTNYKQKQKGGYLTANFTLKNYINLLPKSVIGFAKKTFNHKIRRAVLKKCNSVKIPFSSKEIPYVDRYLYEKIIQEDLTYFGNKTGIYYQANINEGTE